MIATWIDTVGPTILSSSLVLGLMRSKILTFFSCLLQKAQTIWGDNMNKTPNANKCELIYVMHGLFAIHMIFRIDYETWDS